MPLFLLQFQDIETLVYMCSNVHFATDTNIKALPICHVLQCFKITMQPLDDPKSEISLKWF